MTANINEKTGIPYGVINANDVPFLYDDIVSRGEDLTYMEFRENLKLSIAKAIEGAISEHCFHPDEVVARGVDLSELVDSLLDAGINDQYEWDESDYSYEYQTEHGLVRLLTGWLGGAPLIWVLESPWVVGCRQCSPCVPNAGDLNNPDENGSVAYCLPPDDLPEDWEGPVPQLLSV